MRARARLFTAGAVAAGIALVPGVALAAAGGYGPTTGTGPANTPGAYTQNVATVSVDATGAGSLSGSVPGATAQVTAPAGSLPAGAQIEATAPDLSGVTSGLSGVGFSGYKAVAGIGVKVFNADGTPMTGNFSKPVTVTLTGSGLGASGEKVVMFTGATAASAIPATVANGSVTFTINADPNIAVIDPTSAAVAGTVANATSTHTGLPITGEEAAIAGLVVVGVGGLAMARRRATR